MPPAKSSGSSKAVFGGMLLGGLPFAALGLLALVQGIRRYGKTPDAIVPIAIGSVFALVGLLLIFGAFFAAAAIGRSDALKSQNPDKPWMWREDWARGIIKDSNKGQAIGFWIFAVLWNAVAFPVGALTWQQVDKEHLLMLLVLIFPLIGVCLLIAAVYKTLRSMKFGTSICRLDPIPVAPGRACTGAIELNTEATPQNGYRLKIASIHVVTSGSGKNRSTSEIVQWDEEIAIDPAAAMRSPNGTRVPFKFVTPPDAHATDESDSDSRYIWRLAASAELPGVDYAAQFEIPVFQTGEAAGDSEFADFEQRHRAEAARKPVSQTSGVTIAKMPGGGEEFHIHARKTIGGVLGSLIFLAAWNAGVGLMIHFGANWIVTGVVILLDVVFLLSSFDYFFGRSTVTVDPAGVRVRKEWFGAGSTKLYESATIASIDGVTAGQNNSFGVKMKLTDGGIQLLGSYLPDRTSADAVAAKMMADLGR